MFAEENLPKIKETRIFLIKVLIKDKNGKVKMLKKEQELEIVWEGGRGKFRDFEFGGLPEGEKVKIIRFQDGGENYNVAIGWLQAQKGWFGDKITAYRAEPVPIDAFTIIKHRREDEVRHGKTLWQKDISSEGIGRHCQIENYQWRQQGKIMVWTFVFLVFLLGILLWIIAWKKMKSEKK